MPAKGTGNRKSKSTGSQRGRSARTRRKPQSEWQPVFYETAKGQVPGKEFVERLQKEEKHKTPRRELLKILLAVCKVGPRQYPASMGWHAMHKSKAKGEVDMSGIHEVRDRHGGLLYRLFCVVDGNAPDHGLALSSIVVLDGAVKPVDEGMSQAVYKRIDRYRRDYEATHRIKTRPKPKKAAS